MPHRELELHLWDLRAQVEAQLRCLTKIHRVLTDLPNTAAVERPRQKERLLDDLEEVLAATVPIRSVTEQSIALAKLLAVD